jgi:hypothetical protein
MKVAPSALPVTLAHWERAGERETVMAAATYILWGGADAMAVSPALAALPIHVDPVSPEPVLEAVIPLASEHGISVYDAMYLELALRLGLLLATFDCKLAAACGAAGAQTLPAR